MFFRLIFKPLHVMAASLGAIVIIAFMLTPLSERMLLSIAHAQSTPVPHKRFDIKSISPHSSDPGAVIEIVVGVDLKMLPMASDAKVFFDDTETVVVGIDYSKNTISVIVPWNAKAGSSPLVLVRIGDDASFPYPGFRVSPSSWQRLADFYAVPLQFLGIIILALSGAVTILLMIRARSRERYVKEQAKLFENITRRRREVPIGLNEPNVQDDSVASSILTPVEPPEELMRACATSECVLFTGSRFPTELGEPTTSALVATLLESARGRLRERDLEAMRLALDEGELESTKDFLSAKLESAFIQQELSKALGASTPSGRIVDTLRKIGFAGAITTNWDHSLNRIFASKLKSAPLLFPSLFQNNEFFLFKAFGDPNDSEFAFTLQDYRQKVEETPQINRFLSTAFSKNSILYLGCSVDEIERFILASRIRAHTDRQHFALVPESPLIELQRERMLARYRVQLLVCKPGDDQAISDFLSALRNRLPATPRIARAQGVRPKIDELTLTNIGPFKEATINFETSKTIFLGNNGCGKSTVLKANCARTMRR